ncbi:MAG: mechanosensitive ion channel [Bryobacterales bacterium]|nr:mechanosensitive ion channel [Bryobacterales bacterium]
MKETLSSYSIFASITAGKLAIVLAAFGAVWISLRYLRRGFEAIALARPRMRFLARSIEPVLRILLWFAAGLFALEVLAPSWNAFLAAIGSAALAIGLGAQDLIKNLIGGFVIIADRPYQLGDRVDVGGVYGEVRHIGLRSTKLVTPDDRLVTIPNSVVLGATAQNANAGVPECLVDAELYVPANSDPDLVLRVGRETLLTSPFLSVHSGIRVHLEDGFADQPFLRLRLKGYVYDHRFEPQMRTDLVRRAKSEFLRLGVLRPAILSPRTEE